MKKITAIANSLLQLAATTLVKLVNRTAFNTLKVKSLPSNLITYSVMPLMMTFAELELAVNSVGGSLCNDYDTIKPTLHVYKPLLMQNMHTVATPVLS